MKDHFLFGLNHRGSFSRGGLLQYSFFQYGSHYNGNDILLHKASIPLTIKCMTIYVPLELLTEHRLHSLQKLQQFLQIAIPTNKCTEFTMVIADR